MVGKIFILTVFLVGVHSLPYIPAVSMDDSANFLKDNLEGSYFENEFEPLVPTEVNLRVPRQAGVVNTNPDGTMNLIAKVPITGNDKNVLSVIGSGTALRPDGMHVPAKSYGSVSGGLALDNVNGHGLSLTSHSKAYP